VRITDDYLDQNVRLHGSTPTYGTSGWQYAQAVIRLARQHGTEDVLDYGCGKGTLAEALPFPIRQYDPAILEHSDEPEPADIVVCGDVMEHIEPHCLDDVLNHIHRLTRVCTYWVIATRKAAKTLPDGRNCHLIVESRDWWVKKLAQHDFSIAEESRGRKGEIILTTGD
jgi:hypothetical protein